MRSSLLLSSSLSLCLSLSLFLPLTTHPSSLGAEKRVRAGRHSAEFQLSSPTRTVTVHRNLSSSGSSLNLATILRRCPEI